MKYRPSNGSEGMDFMTRFCDQCVYEDWEGDKECPIIGATMIYDVDDPEYPEEWTYDQAGDPICTKFIRERGER